jgi:hypothetical protein
MAYPTEVNANLAVGYFEDLITTDKTLVGAREASEKLRELVAWVDSISASTSYAADLVQTTWSDEDLYNGPND